MVLNTAIVILSLMVIVKLVTTTTTCTLRLTLALSTTEALITIASLMLILLLIITLIEVITAMLLIVISVIVTEFTALVTSHVFGKPIPHILVLLIPTWRPLRHTLTHIMIVCAVTALNLSLIACAISWIDLLVGSVLIFFRVGFRISRLVWGRCNLEADVVVNLRELELF